MSVLSLNLECNSSLSMHTALQSPNKRIPVTNGGSGTRCRPLETMAERYSIAFVLKRALQPLQTLRSRSDISDIGLICFP
jgi:hypothetical protein